MTGLTPIGVHCRVSGGLATGGIRHATETAAEAVQVFVSNPQGWALSPGNPEQDATFRQHMLTAGIPVFVHAPYLVNLGSPTAETAHRSSESLAHAVGRGRDIGARGVVVHTGSAVGTGHRAAPVTPRNAMSVRPRSMSHGLTDTGGGGDAYENRRRVAAMLQVRDRLLRLLEEIPGEGPDILLEPTAGQGQSLCGAVQDLGPYLSALDYHPRLGVCLDTCHLFAAGHDLAAAGGVEAVLRTFDEVAGRARLRLVHANDSVDVCGSRRDRHANIGEGQLGERPFRTLLHHPVVRGVPVVVETPGGVEKHRRDVETLKRLRDDSCHD